MQILKGANLFGTFLLELGVLAGVAVWGFTLPAGLLVRVIAGVATPALFVLMWALFGAGSTPRFPLRGTWRLALELIWFGGGALAWATATTPVTGLVFVALWAVNALLRVLLQGGLLLDNDPSDPPSPLRPPTYQ
ncbi:YrdB family protein [Nocardia sp. NPDC060256]|uniref:YrdB family protein n=1 Tax=unclassified Nocardia TaxID=2637762 RepID=UPI0036546181